MGDSVTVGSEGGTGEGGMEQRRWWSADVAGSNLTTDEAAQHATAGHPGRAAAFPQIFASMVHPMGAGLRTPAGRRDRADAVPLY